MSERTDIGQIELEMVRRHEQQKPLLKILQKRIGATPWTNGKFFRLGDGPSLRQTRLRERCGDRRVNHHSVMERQGYEQFSSENFTELHRG